MGVGIITLLEDPIEVETVSMGVALLSELDGITDTLASGEVAGLATGIEAAEVEG